MANHASRAAGVFVRVAVTIGWQSIVISYMMLYIPPETPEEIEQHRDYCRKNGVCCRACVSVRVLILLADWWRQIDDAKETERAREEMAAAAAAREKADEGSASRAPASDRDRDGDLEFRGIL